MPYRVQGEYYYYMMELPHDTMLSPNLGGYWLIRTLAFLWDFTLGVVSCQQMGCASLSSFMHKFILLPLMIYNESLGASPASQAVSDTQEALYKYWCGK